MQLQWLEPHGFRSALGPAELEAAGVLHESCLPDPRRPKRVEERLEHLRVERGYIERDEVELRPDTPDLPAICARFAAEHLHTDDEVRYVLEGEGIFDIRSVDDQWMRITVEAGDLIVVPANRHHRFLLTKTQHIRCVRLFKDRTGWVPHYRDAGQSMM